MSGDYSRISFDPWQDDLGVLLQQGRPLSDAEWNALVAQLRRRLHAGTLDTIGAAVVPLQTPEGFEPSLLAGALRIGRGRIYVDGLLAENHGAGPNAWEPRLEELIGTQPVDYAAQPYYPNPPALPDGGPHLIYLDVWQREITYLTRPELIEKAVGVDSTTRLQTVWQVKLLNNVGTANAACPTPLDKHPGWLPANAPSAGRLSTATAVVPGEPDPCLIPPGAGYKGLENQLYRIEIHHGGTLGAATFKWPRDNASVETRVTHIPALDQLTVESIGKDTVLRFSDGDWVEISDDWQELHNLPGELRRIKIGGGVDDATRTILLEDPLTAGLFPTDAQHRTQPGRHTRIKRWDQRGKVLDHNGNVLQDLDPAASNGEITVPAGAGTGVLLEHGIVARFTLDPAGGEFRSGDHWLFAARSTDATIEELDKAPPRGIHHHYAKLGYVTFPNTVDDCRTFWPPPDQVGEGGDHCACTVCVTPQAHAAGQPSLQTAIEQVIKAGGGTVCLEVGGYNLDAPLQIRNARSLRIVGKGHASVLRSAATAIAVDEDSKDVTLESFAIECRAESTAPGGALFLRDSEAVRVERLRIQVADNSTGWAAVALGGALASTILRENILLAPMGIVSVAAAAGNGATGLMDLQVEDNSFGCQRIGIRFSGLSVHQFVSRIAGNRILGCVEAGIVLTGATVPGFGIEVSGNELMTMGDGIVASLDGLRIVDNDLVALRNTADKSPRGIVLSKDGMAGDNGLDACEIIGNRIVDHVIAIGVQTPLASVMIARNWVQRADFGVLFETTLPIGVLSVDNNQFERIEKSALHIEGAEGRIAASGNQIEVDGATPAVEIVAVRGDCLFSGNHCQQPNGEGNGTVRLGGDTLIVASNRIFDEGKLSLVLTPGGTRELPRCTVLGNIARGDIVLRFGSTSVSLPAPWAPLNHRGF